MSRAPFACDPAAAGPRLVAEPPPQGRTPFQRDRDRILHSMAFRRLALKTQVFMPGEDDHVRTRLTHSLEVAQVARSMARALGLDEDLTEALALAHDLGHTPFGHTGEAALDAVMALWGGFDHNAQSLRVVVDLEQRYLDFDGLNLTWDTLEGLAKRGGPCAAPSALLGAYDARIGLALECQPSAEAQVAAVADDIAYNAHDIEDGLRAGLITLAEAAVVPPVAALIAAIERGRTAVEAGRMPFALARALGDSDARDAHAETRARPGRLRPASAAAVRRLDEPVVGLSPAGQADAGAIKAFLFAHLYRHPRLLPVRAQAGDLVTALARRLLDDPAALPPGPAARAAAGPAATRARIVSDHVAGLTDIQARREHGRLFDAPPEFV